MSNNQTVIPGLNGMQQASTQPAFYPQGAPTITPNSTVIPGVGPQAFAGQPVQPQAQSSQGQIFGFLFSVSKTMAGEYWPIMLGANTIGRGSQNSIVLAEGTVSDTHASIHVISRANKLIVYIKDDESKTGTLLNGTLLRGEADLNSGDIVTIGEHYELYVVLINATDLGLGVKEEFVAVAQQPSASQFTQAMPQRPMGSPFAGPAQRPVMTGGTVVEGSSGSAPVGGHTVIMGGPKF